MIYAYFTLVVALVISCVAEYYSIVGLTAIFSAAFWPIVIMGASLGVGKITAAVWLKMNWDRAPITYKLYLVPAVVFLMFLTSIGCFGFLSKAHSDQNLVSGDVGAKIAIYDEKIKTSKENIEANRKALKQMDEAVDQMMGRSTDEKGADKAVAVRRGQAKERARLQQEITTEQATIAKLSEEAAPIRAEVRQVENETGPLKYIAAIIYGDNPDANILEKAVRFVIIMIVAVFDPLALVLILAAQQSMRWEREDEEREEEEGMKDVEDFFKRGKELARQLDREAAEQAANELVDTVEADPSSEISGDNKTDVEESILDKHPYLNKPFSHFEGLEPMVYKPEPEIKLEYNEDGTMKPLEGEQAYQLLKQVGIFDENDKLAPEYGGEEPPDDKETVDLIEKWDEELHEEIAKLEEKADAIIEPVKEVKTEIVTQNVTREIPLFDPQTTSHVNFDGKYTSLESLRMTNPEVILKTGERIPNSFKFGTDFPKEAYSGDLFMRVDNRPHRLFKFNGGEWIHVNKNMNTSYLQEEAYIQYLIDALNNNQYLPEMLTEAEDDEIRNYLKNQ